MTHSSLDPNSEQLLEKNKLSKFREKNSSAAGKGPTSSSGKKGPQGPKAPPFTNLITQEGRASQAITNCYISMTHIPLGENTHISPIKGQ